MGPRRPKGKFIQAVSFVLVSLDGCCAGPLWQTLSPRCSAMETGNRHSLQRLCPGFEAPFSQSGQWAQLVYLFTDAFGWPAVKDADYRTRHSIPVEISLNCFADWDNTRLFSSSGAYHGVDLHMVSVSHRGVTGDPESPGQGWPCS